MAGDPPSSPTSGNAEPEDQHAAPAPTVIAVTGIMASGKTTVAGLLARRFPSGVHIEADALQRMIVAGGAWVEEPGEPQGEAARQLRLRLRNMCLLARSFYAAGFSVVLDDIILGARWGELQDELRDVPFTLVVLAPAVEVVAGQRDRGRDKPPLGSTWAAYLDRELRATMAGIGLWIDTSAQTPQATVEAIWRHLASGRGPLQP